MVWPLPVVRVTSVTKLPRDWGLLPWAFSARATGLATAADRAMARASERIFMIDTPCCCKGTGRFCLSLRVLTGQGRIGLHDGEDFFRHPDCTVGPFPSRQQTASLGCLYCPSPEYCHERSRSHPR